jgi:predicted nucleic acid-binding protein
MILVDTSIWIDHLRSPDPVLGTLLRQREVVQHPFVIAEIALGSIANRATVIEQLELLPASVVVDDGELLAFIESAELPAKGIGFVDAHLLMSVSITEGFRLWTRDKRLLAQAERLDLAYQP